MKNITQEDEKNRMKKTLVSLVSLLVGSLFSTALLAAEIPAAVTAQLNNLLPNKAPDALQGTPVPGLYEARFGTSILYISADGRYLIDGNMLDMEQRRNLTEESIEGARVEILNGMDESEMVVYQPAESKRVLTVFTDIDCPYCVRLHEEREALLDAGIKLRYLLYPRAGINSPSYDKSVNVWCSEDRAAALTDAKAGVEVDAKVCETPILSHIQMAASFDLKGTPHIVIDNGEVIGGYMPAQNLIQKLGLN